MQQEEVKQPYSIATLPHMNVSAACPAAVPSIRLYSGRVCGDECSGVCVCVCVCVCVVEHHRKREEEERKGGGERTGYHIAHKITLTSAMQCKESINAANSN